MSQPNCMDCKHFFVTWDQHSPKGCRLYQIKSKAMPSEIVKAAGSGDCQGFVLKKQKDRDPYADYKETDKQN